MTWDDHEVENDYASEWSELMETTPRDFLRRRAAAYQGSGTSADVQLALFGTHGKSGGDEAGLRAIVEWVSEATLR